MAFHPIDRDTDYLLPPSVQGWLPDSHLARYVVEGLDLSALELAYAGRGSDAYHPATLLSLLIYGYFSEKNVATCEVAKITALIAVGREEHHPDLAGSLYRAGTAGRRSKPGGAAATCPPDQDRKSTRLNSSH